MNSDMVPVKQLEQGMKTLTHDWRNLLNGINLQVIAATTAVDVNEREADLAEAGRLIIAATREISSFSRKLMPPQVSPIPYPTVHLIEDIGMTLGRRPDQMATRLDWHKELGKGKALVDFAFFTDALAELIINSLRHTPVDSLLNISVIESPGFLTFSWSEPATAPLSTELWGETPFLSTERGHLGLGLYFARRVLEAHEGTLKFDFSTASQILRTTLQIPLEKI